MKKQLTKYKNHIALVLATGAVMFFFNWGSDIFRESVEHKAEAKAEYKIQLEEFADYYANITVGTAQSPVKAGGVLLVDWKMGKLMPHKESRYLFHVYWGFNGAIVGNIKTNIHPSGVWASNIYAQNLKQRHIQVFKGNGFVIPPHLKPGMYELFYIIEFDTSMGIIKRKLQSTQFEVIE